MTALQHDLTAACERALVAGARSQRAGTRQQLRAAARRFVRRHRRDAGYLRWVLRSVAASSALAVALLGLGAEPAQAKATLFSELTGAANPLDGQDVGTFSTSALGDLDGDGDLDVFAGTRVGTFRYLENTGSASSPAFVARTGAANPLDGQDVGFFSAPVLADLDRDGDLDLVAGEDLGGFFYFENTGSAASPAFIQRTGAANPLGGQSTGGASTPALGDLDRDGDLDLIAGQRDGSFRAFENTGSATSPAFIERTGDGNPLIGVDVGDYSAPALGDLDRDGDLDLVSGEYYGPVRYFENTGSVRSASFAARINAANPLDGQDFGNAAAPSLGDLDGDGDLELVAGEDSGRFRTYENLANAWVALTGTANPLDGVSLAPSQERSAPEFGDLDGDGDLDLVAGTDYGTFLYFENTGSASSPAFVARTGAANPLDGKDVGVYAAPALGDLDGDGDLDLISGQGVSSEVRLGYCENTGSATAPAFGPLETFIFWETSGSLFESVDPALGDLDGDGDLDLVVGGRQFLPQSSSFLYVENTGGAQSPAFVAHTGTANPLAGLNPGFGGRTEAPALGDLDRDGDLDLVSCDEYGRVSNVENIGSAANLAFIETGLIGQLLSYSMPALADVDGDGDLDLVSAEQSGTLLYFENAIVNPSLSAFELSGGASPLFGEDVGGSSATALGDLDADGDLDLVAGETYGQFPYFENTGSAASPAFVRRTGAANPLDGEDAGNGSTPALGDLDADGDLDLVAGSNQGLFSYFANTGSATSPAFASRTGAENPFDGLYVFNSAATLGDLDGDGDLDFVAGSNEGTFFYFENTGSVTSPAFIARTGADNPLDGQDAGRASTPVLGDLDRDGDLDLLAGEEYGTLPYFENRGGATSPAFVSDFFPPPPFDGEDLGYRTSPTLGDLDGDGDLDVVSGERDGGFRTYYLPEPAQSTLLGAGIALLSLLARLRGRREHTG